MKKPFLHWGFFIAVILSLSTWSCSDSGDSGSLSALQFSRDTIYFDTVFTQMGSATEVVLLRNTSGSLLTIDRISLSNNSVFRMNVDGFSGNDLQNIEILPNDSIYIFLEVTLNPNGGNAPLIHQDSIQVELGGNTKKAQIVAFGQDANYILPTDTLLTGGGFLPYSIIPCNTTWDSPKPYVIVGYAVVDENCGLTIAPGTQVHFFNNGALWVFENAKIQALGQAGNEIVFEGTRLENQYREEPGQWDRILINEGSTGNVFRHCIIKNGFIGLQCDNVAALTGTGGVANKVTLENVQIRNMSGLGIFTRNYNVEATNLLVSNCGQYGGAFTFGGTLKFSHSTFANYWSNSNRQFPTVFINNYFFDGQTVAADDLNFTMENSIVYGGLENEFGYDTVTTAAMNFRFDHCLLKLANNFPTSNPLRFNQIIKNQDPRFTNTLSGDYTPLENSPVLLKGDPNVIQQNPSKLTFDLVGKNRTLFTAPDLGALQRK